MDIEAKYKVNQHVRKKNHKELIGFIMEPPTIQQTQIWYKIKLYDDKIVFWPENTFELYVLNANPEDYFLESSFSGRESLSRIITFNKLAGGYQNNPTALKASRTLFKPHQYKPLLKFLYSDSQRLLIADEVGLGKTIEAGYILLELMARKQLRTVLIICPKSLCVKWERELIDKFYLSFEISTKERFLKFLYDYDRGVITKPFHAIISYQAIRNKKIRDRLKEINPEIDLVIFDEMHWSRNETSQTFRLAKSISEFSASVIGLTATPIMLGNRNLYNLLNILNPYEFQSEIDFNQRIEVNKHITEAIRSLTHTNYESALKSLEKLSAGISRNQFQTSPLYESIRLRLKENDRSRENTIKLLKDITELSLLSHIVTRTRRKETELKATRHSLTVRLKFTSIEKMFYDTVTKFLKDKYNLYSAHMRESSFVLMMPQRQVASCIPAMIKSYSNNNSFLQKLGESLDLTSFDSFDIEDETLENDRGITSFSNELIDILKSFNGNIDNFVDSKYNEFVKALNEIFKNEPNSKILVFSYFKPTLNYLRERLKKDGYPCYLMSGDVVPEERQEIMDSFRYNSDIRVLLSSEVGSEGIDLEFCNVVVNYDLPWNPMIVEQRIGRIDRFGQQSEVVTIVNFAIEDTIEERILNRLYERINIFRESIGDLEEILGEEIRKLEHDLLTSRLTPDEQEKRIEEAANLIIERKIEAQRLEEQSAGLLTNDEFFKQEIDAILSEKRYVTTEELVIYIDEFLKVKFPDCRIKGTSDNNVYKLYISPEFENSIRALLREKGLLDDYAYCEFFNKIQTFDNRELNFTLDPEYAHTHKKIAQLNNFHPIVRYITEYLKQNPTDIFPCSSICMKSSQHLPKGLFYYFTYEFSILGGRNYKSLSHIILDEAGSEAASESQAAELMADIITQENIYHYDLLDTDINRKEILNKAQSIQYERFSKIQEEIIRLNDSNIKKQLDITDRIHNSKVSRIRETIAEVKHDPLRKRIIPALEGQIKKLISEKQQIILEIEAKRDIDSQTRLLAAGILKII